MVPDNPLKSAKDAAALVGEVIKAAGKDPNAREAGAELGKAALTITRAINNALLPLAAVNFAFEKARVYFSDKFGSDLASKLRDVPLDQVSDPKASVAGPALQGLAFSHEEPDLKEMYLSLLASAMDKRVSYVAHPAYVEIIRQLDAEEARLLHYVVGMQGASAIVQIRLMLTATDYWVISRHFPNFGREMAGLKGGANRLEAMIDNWIRLGLVDVDYATSLALDTAYAWVEAHPEFQALRKKYEHETQPVVFQRGLMRRTAFGAQFARAVGIIVRPEDTAASD